jgi:cysteine desulfurase family protein (TIGR01976 family)
MSMTTTASIASAVTPIAEIRRSFPALERKHKGFPVAYFDGPGGTQVPRLVVDRIADYLYNHNANTHWAYPTSHETDALIDEARAAMADFLNASPQEIVYGANMTTLTFHVARAIGRSLKPGDEIVVTELDHHANVAPWTALARDYGASIRTVKMNPATGQLDWADLEKCLSGQPKLLAMGAASNALGTINDITRAAAIAHSAGALVFVDAVHYAPHELVDVKAIDCDFLCCSAYKFYGPHIGILYARSEVLERTDFPKLLPAPDTGPERAETGTLNHEGMVGATAAVDFLASLAEGDTRRGRLESSFAELHTRGIGLVTQLWEGLSAISGVQLFGPAPDKPRTPTVSFVVKGKPSGEIATRLAEKGLFVSHGDFYAKTAVERLGQSPEGIVRAGCACYATSDEVTRLVEGVREIVK